MHDHIKAAAAYLSRLTIPDPVDLADMRAADPSALLAVIRRRAEQERFPRSRTVLILGKGFDPSAYRLITVLDSIDQLGYRLLVTPAANALATRVPRSVVAHRVELRRNAWISRDRAWRERRDLFLSAFSADQTLWLVKLDVKDYFPSLSDEVLARSLRTLGLEDWEVDPIVAFRSSFDELPGTVRGLPVGPEASAVLGTLGLNSLDRLFARVKHTRLVDDVWLVADSEQEAASLADCFAEHMTQLSMQENEAKRQIVAGADALGAISDTDIDYATASGEQVSVNDALRLLSRAMEDRNDRRLRFALGALARDRAGTGVAKILENDELLMVEPLAAGRLLRSAAPSLDRDAVDSLVAYASSESDDRRVPGRIQVAHALGGADLTLEQRERLLDAASITADRRLQPLRAHLAAAACRRARSKSLLNRAVELAECADNFDLRRSVLYAHRRAQVGRHVPVARQLLRLEPDLAPFVVT